MPAVADRPFEPGPAKQSLWSPQRMTDLARNAVKAYSGAGPTHRALGARFYPDWHEDADFIGHRAGLSTEHGAAMMARLSPSTEAEANRLMAYQLHHVDSRATAHIHESAALATQAMGKGLSEDHKDALKAHSKALRVAAGLPGTPLNLQTSSNISVALRIRDGEAGAHPLDTLGQAKIRDFGGLIHDPGATRQPIDTHYHDALHGRTDIPYNQNRGLGSTGRYEAHQESARRAYETAGRKGALDPRETNPGAFMGTVWHAQQEAKVRANPDATKARKAAQSRLTNFLSSSQAHHWDPAVAGQRPVNMHLGTFTK